VCELLLGYGVSVRSLSSGGLSALHLAAQFGRFGALQVLLAPRGPSSVDPDLQSYFEMNRASRLQVLLRLRVPSALPYFFGGLRISSGLALIGAVVAEFVAGTGGNSTGLAYQILYAGYQLNIPRMFAALLLISLTGVALFVLMAWLSRAALGSWHASELSRD
jgi:NitT/TauT family transport system permease protein